VCQALAGVNGSLPVRVSLLDLTGIIPQTEGRWGGGPNSEEEKPITKLDLNLEVRESAVGLLLHLRQSATRFESSCPSTGFLGSYLLQSIVGEHSGKSTEVFRQTIHFL
jgi:hypothetical protein